MRYQSDLKKKAKFGSLPEREAAGMTGKRTSDEGKSKENELETEQACSVSETEPAEEQASTNNQSSSGFGGRRWSRVDTVIC